MILIGRSESKLNEINTNIPSIKIIHDFNEKLSKLKFNEIEKCFNDKKCKILINCVGIGPNLSNLSNNYSYDSYLTDCDLISSNISSHILMTRLFLSSIKKNQLSNSNHLIVNISSYLSEFNSSGMAIYSSSKNFLNNFSKCLYVETKVEQMNIDIILLKPWFIDTNMIKIKNLNGLITPYEFVNESFIRFYIKKRNKQKNSIFFDSIGSYSHCLSITIFKIKSILNFKMLKEFNFNISMLRGHYYYQWMNSQIKLYINYIKNKRK